MLVSLHSNHEREMIMKSEKMRTWNEAMKSGCLDSWDNYIGSRDHANLFNFLGQSRDSDCLEKSNFDCGLELLGGESDIVQVHRFGHWAVGWIEEILIDPVDWIETEWRSGAWEHNWYMLEADRILSKLEDYPVVNEEHWCEMENEQAEQYWEQMRLAERVELCQRFGVSVFAARHDWIPQDDTGDLYEYLRTD